MLDSSVIHHYMHYIISLFWFLYNHVTSRGFALQCSSCEVFVFIVMDWSYALARFLFPRVSSTNNFSHCICGSCYCSLLCDVLCLRSKEKVGNLSRPPSFTSQHGLIMVCLTMPRPFLGSTVGSSPNTSHQEVPSWSTAVLVWDAQALTLPLIMSSIRSQPRVSSIFPVPLSNLATRG